MSMDYDQPCHGPDPNDSCANGRSAADGIRPSLFSIRETAFRTDLPVSVYAVTCDEIIHFSAKTDPLVEVKREDFSKAVVNNFMAHKFTSFHMSGPKLV
jgi:hypothetical protein